MARAPARKKKKGPDLRQQFNDLLTKMWEGRQGVTPKLLEEYMQVAEAQNRLRIKRAKPRKADDSKILGELIFTKTRNREARTDRKAFAAAIDLASMLEEGSKKGKIKFKDWVDA